MARDWLKVTRSELNPLAKNIIRKGLQHFASTLKVLKSCQTLLGSELEAVGMTEKKKQSEVLAFLDYPKSLFIQ
ncbi:hypothetical protein cce_1200 [Crocosphaera subtropica ATCC 51142]|uniref:Uncharacterized protein n=1 Tax=Crocosphaera subtropica (strain ATCC 51142 / BH68) TaxID=43989 RepID=B1WUU9_CROS5|nr:hypothetical protein cce_1200 [Crocosphaera subtropica ATCC 51142]